MALDPFDGAAGPFLSDFRECIKSDTRLNSLYPEIKLYYSGWMSRAPFIKIRVSVLTATEYSTIKSTEMEIWLLRLLALSSSVRTVTDYSTLKSTGI